MRIHSASWLVVLALVGCTTSSTSNTARTGTEQLLVSNAIDQSLNQVDFSPFAGKSVFLDEAYLDCVDKKYVVSSIRHRLLRTGCQVVTAMDQADIVIEPRSGGVGTHSSDLYFGFPEVALPGMVALPEMRLIERKNQQGIAKIGLIAYDAKTKTALGTGGMTLSQSDNNNWFVLGVGPYQNGTVQEELSNSKKGKAKNNSLVPSSVAFSAPPTVAPLHEPSKVQLAGGEEPAAVATTAQPEAKSEPKPLAKPAAQTADRPEWAR